MFDIERMGGDRLVRHVHLDPIGGLAGDMFVAAMASAFPALAPAALAAAEEAAPVRCRIVPHKDHVLAGHRFEVTETGHHHDAHDDHHAHHHHHAHWSGIRARLGDVLPPGIREVAIGIFQGLAEAEALVHGIDPEQVAFHEVGAADSIADIVAAASFIDALPAATWSVGPLPLGGGRVMTAHGPMPVPAPATARLLEGFEMIDDGVGGERVTPTGAAILRWLRPAAKPSPLRLGGTGIGFGTRVLPGLSNCVRVLDFAREPGATTHRDLLVVTFEVDDQSGEDLAAGLDRLRAEMGIYDVLQSAAIGKKGRMTTHIQVLGAPEAADAVAEACFRETTTIGLRTQIAASRTLPRRMAEVAVDEATVRVKLVDRPGGVTGKAESDDLLRAGGQAERTRLRRRAEEGAA